VDLGAVYADIQEPEEVEQPSQAYVSLVTEAVTRLNVGYRAYCDIEDAVHVVTKTRINSAETAARVIRADESLTQALAVDANAFTEACELEMEGCDKIVNQLLSLKRWKTDVEGIRRTIRKGLTARQDERSKYRKCLGRA